MRRGVASPAAERWTRSATLVIDRAGPGDNCEEITLAEPVGAAALTYPPGLACAGRGLSAVHRVIAQPCRIACTVCIHFCAPGQAHDRRQYKVYGKVGQPRQAVLFAALIRHQGQPHPHCGIIRTCFLILPRPRRARCGWSGST